MGAVETPASLEALRAAVAASEGWYRRGRRLSEADRAALSENARGETQWRYDPRLVEDLVRAEREFTATFRP